MSFPIRKHLSTWTINSKLSNSSDRLRIHSFYNNDQICPMNYMAQFFLCEKPLKALTSDFVQISNDSRKL